MILSRTRRLDTSKALTIPLVLFSGTDILQTHHQLYQAIDTLFIPSDLHRSALVCTHMLGLDSFRPLRLYLLHDSNPASVQPNIKRLATLECRKKLFEHLCPVVQQRTLQYFHRLHPGFDGATGYIYPKAANASETSIDRSFWSGGHCLGSIDLTSYNPLLFSIWYRCHGRFSSVNHMDNGRGWSRDHLRQFTNVKNTNPAFLPAPFPFKSRN